MTRVISADRLAKMALGEPWYRVEIVSGVDLAKPGIYEWRIDGVGTYIGKYTRATRPFREYALNVARIQQGRPYRSRKPNGFRRIHRELAAAKGRVAITLTILENVAPERLAIREAEVIRERGTLNGPVIAAP